MGPPAPDPRGRDALVERAKEVLDRNWTGHSTIPAPGLYPHQWNWDTGFIAIGRSRYDQARAETEMLSLFTGQWRTGMLPHIVFNPDVPADAYFPGPDFWRSESSNDAPPGVRTSGLTQPPVHAFAALEMHRHAADREQSANFLRRIFPGLAAQHRYFREHRAVPELDGLTYFLHPWESGLDNSPAWDEAFGSFDVPAGTLPPYQRRDLEHADPRDRPSAEAYDRFVYLSLVYRDAGYDDARTRDLTPFLVADPMFNSIWAWSAAALAEIAVEVGEDPTEFEEDAGRIVRAIEDHLWEPGYERFFPYDIRDGAHMDHHSIVCFMPLVAPGMNADKAHRTAESMDDARHCGDVEPCYLLPTFDPQDQLYNPRLYWRGPIWINTDWLLYKGCRANGQDARAEELKRSVLELVAAQGFREYFGPHGDAGYGADSFSWTASLYLDLALEGAA